MTAVPQAWRGQTLGLPETGPGSLSTTGRRLLSFIVDSLASALIAGLFVQVIHHGHHHDVAGRLPGSWSLVPFALDYLLGILFAGRTLGMYLFGLRIVRVDRDEAVTPWRAFTRTLLLMLLIPAVVWDRDGRGLHDRYSDTAVVNG
jgi:uncharacterized RDD family membrane protein YckC